MFDLAPATTEMTRLIGGVRADDLDRPTPCDDWTVRDLLAHIHQFVDVFTCNARKDPLQPPDALVDDWRTAIPARLEELAAAWRRGTAWEGQVTVGGVAMSAADNAVVAAEELTVHAWDLARATGQEVQVASSMLDRVDEFLEMFAPGTDDDAFGSSANGPFGPVGPLFDGAGRLDRIVAQTGRDPAWGSSDS
ncbi:TIGR03086 family metal-binding protein [Williamsia sp. SKLECPSW1]